MAFSSLTNLNGELYLSGITFSFLFILIGASLVIHLEVLDIKT